MPSLNELHLLRANLYDKGLEIFTQSLLVLNGSKRQPIVRLDWITSESSSLDKSSTEPKVRPIHSFNFNEEIMNKSILTIMLLTSLNAHASHTGLWRAIVALGGPNIGPSSSSQPASTTHSLSGRSRN
ncbi:hypothetical protein [Legionella sp. PC1000]|uniref:hypothetical protein n=1 Tax=Legionella sp. PC1000 TaxID=2746060 RepID=UPI0015F8DB5D|nr:hypothetical protein [Legionella sp. PC1000]